MSHIDNEISFCEAMCNFLNSGYSLQASVEIICSLKSSGYNVRKGAVEIRKGLEKGKIFSVCLSDNQYLKFSDEYISIFETAENTGKVFETFRLVLQMMKEKKSIREKTFQVMIYPFSVVALCLSLSFVLFLYSDKLFSLFGLSEQSVYLHGLINNSLISSNIFLIIVILIFKFYWNGLNKLGIMKSFFSILEFIVEEKQDLLIGLDLFFKNIRNLDLKKKSFLCVKKLEEGKSLYESFLVFGKEYASYLEYSEFTADVSKSISLSKKMIENQHDNKVGLFLRLLEPSSMFIVAVYLILLFGKIFMYFMSFSVENSFL